MSALSFLVPGRLATRTGGYGYDRRIIDGLRARGWSVDVRELDGSYPSPTPSARAEAARVLAGLPDGTTVLVDGLAFGAMPDEAEREASRLTLVALVHHPLVAETGLTPEAQAHLGASETRALAAAKLVIVTSRATAHALDTYGVARDKIAVVEPGTDPAPRASGSGGGVVELLSVATVTQRKGHATLVEALAAIADLPWRLTSVGSLARDPSTVGRVSAAIDAHGLTGRVSLLDEVDGPVLDAFYDRADVFVLPTEYEGYGMAVAEAIARGLPVVSTPSGAIPDIVGEAGLLVPPGDPRALAEALSRVISDGALRRRLADAAARSRESLPTWDTAAAAMAAALGRVTR